jgi:hypothetical protein
MQVSHEPGGTRLVISVQRAWDVDLFLDEGGIDPRACATDWLAIPRNRSGDLQMNTSAERIVCANAPFTADFLVPGRAIGQQEPGL